VCGVSKVFVCVLGLQLKFVGLNFAPPSEPSISNQLSDHRLQYWENDSLKLWDSKSSARVAPAISTPQFLVDHDLISRSHEFCRAPHQMCFRSPSIGQAVPLCCIILQTIYRFKLSAGLKLMASLVDDTRNNRKLRLVIT
jgi:hypothetical protein